MGDRGERLRRSSLVVLCLSLLALLALVSHGDWADDEELLAGAPRVLRRPAASITDGLPAIPPTSTPREAFSLAPVEPAPLIEPVLSPQAKTRRKPEELVPNIDLLILDLANDNVEGNARRARQKLVYFLRKQRRSEDDQPLVTEATVNAYNMRGVCKEMLGHALFSPDHQQRQLAANILIRGSEAPFPPALDAVLVEALRYDPIDSWTCYVSNEADATHYFVSHPEVLARCAPLLRSALSSTDGQQRFLAATILCRDSTVIDVEDVCPLLFEHLVDNDIPGDASMAAIALRLLGRPALPLIEEELAHNPDQQANQLLRSARRAIRSPGGSLFARANSADYTQIYWDAKMSR